MKTQLLPIEQDLAESARQYLAALVLDRKGARHGDKVFVGTLKKTRGVPRRDVLKQFEEAMCCAFTTTVTQERLEDLKIRQFFSMYMQAIDVNWHADDLNPEVLSDEFPLYVCIRHERFENKAGGGFSLNFFISMDSTTMEVLGEQIRVNRDEIYDDLDVLALRYDYLP
jgi:hypothetical protein